MQYVQKYNYNLRLNKKNVLSQSSRARSFLFALPFVLKWQIHFFPLKIFLKTFLSKISNLFTNMKNQNANYRIPLYLTAT